MPISSYLVIAEPACAKPLARHLATLPGCEVVPATNRDVLLLVVESASAEEQDATRERILAAPGVQALALTFGEVTSAPHAFPGALPPSHE